MLAFSSWWHLDMSNNPYHGPRWMGLWYNPNDYGMLMGAGLTLAIGLRAGIKNEKLKCRIRKFEVRRTEFRIILEPPHVGCYKLHIYRGGDDGGGVGDELSRGAWLATAVGLLIWQRCYGRFKWRHIVIGV